MLPKILSLRIIKPASVQAIALLSLSLTLSTPALSYGANFKRNAVVMGTDLEVTVSVEDEATADRALGMAIKEMTRLERMMSEWMPDTFVSKINKNAGKKPVKVPDELFKVIAASQEVSRLTNGAFDISWASMRGVWNFTPGKERVPSSDEIEKKIGLVNYKNIVLDEKKKTVFLKKKGMAIGLGAIAKGYAVDRAMQVIVDSGIKNAIIKAGGDMRVQGLDNGKRWEIGIKHPRQRDSIVAKLRMTNVSISTSGDYERYFIKGGILYHHIIDPKTGYPARLCQSVTIIAPDTMTSDALSTAVFVLGPEEGVKLVKSLKGVQAFIIDSEGSLHVSSGIETAGEVKKPDPPQSGDTQK